MAAFLDVCRFNPTLGGTTDWTYSTAVTGYQSPALAGAVNGQLYRYRAESADLSQWEIGYGIYTVSTTVLTRAVVLYNSSGTGTGTGQSGAGTKITFSTVPQVAVVALAEDLVPNMYLQGRLTLTSGVAVMQTNVAAATTIYYTPCGTTPFVEISTTTTDTTYNPAAIGASKVNDWYTWTDASGVFRLIHGPDWTSDTVRSAGAAQTFTNGITTNAVAITNGPAIGQGRWVGTTRSNSTSTLDFNTGLVGGGTGAAGGSPALVNVWNASNRVQVPVFVQDTTSSWTSTNTAWHTLDSAATGAGQNNRVSFVRGSNEEAVSAELQLFVSSGSGANAAIAIGLDSLTVPAATSSTGGQGAASSGAQTAKYTGLPGLGFHFLQALELGTAPSSTFFGNNGSNILVEGFHALVWC